LIEHQATHICPQCGYEYEPWIEICPDCGVLVETVEADIAPKSSRKGFGPDEDPHWTVVTNVPNAIIGNLIKNQLEDAGIPVLMQRSPSADIAQFSYNDYVPQDLRVPLHMVEDARRLLDSRPDPGVGAPYWYDDADDGNEVDEEADLERPFTAFDTPGGTMPEGWTMLPTERDSRTRDRFRRTHGSVEGWYRSDIGSASEAHERSQARSGATNAQGEYDIDEEPLEADKVRFSQPYEREYYDEAYGGSGPSKWVRIFYGILLLAISLPFLFQLLQQIAAFFNFSR
jgi:hypothetical protein